MSQTNEALFEIHGMSPEHTQEQTVAVGNAMLVALGSGGPLSAAEMDKFLSLATEYGATPDAIDGWKRFDYSSMPGRSACLPLRRGWRRDDADGHLRKGALLAAGTQLDAAQDLAPHRGRTNPEHAYNAYHGHDERNPDKEPSAYALAVELSRTYLERAFEGPLAPCRKAAAEYDRARLDYFGKRALLGHRWQISIGRLLAYRRSANVFEARDASSESPNRVRFFGTRRPNLDDLRTCTDESGCAAVFKQKLRCSRAAASCAGRLENPEQDQRTTRQQW